MNKRNIAIDYLRILGMLGVLAIHVGSFTVNTPNFSPFLFFILEIFSRYSIPVFFFISGFGLFSNLNLYENFNYRRFLKLKLKNLLVPYFLWSLFYYLFFFDTNTRKLFVILGYLHSVLLGYACYHLYFMLLLIIFYITMPFWVIILRKINLQPIYGFIILLTFQISFNHLALIYTPVTDNQLLKTLINFRLNLLVPHYLFIFILGSYFGNNYKNIVPILSRNFKVFLFFLTISLSVLIYKFSLMIAVANLELTVNTLQQLSLPGFFFTTSFIVTTFIFLEIKHTVLVSWQKFLKFLAKSSNIVYFIHPLFLYLVTTKLYEYKIIFDEAIALSTYLAVLLLSLISSFLYNFGIKVIANR